MRKTILTIAILILSKSLFAQIPVDLMAGHQATEFSFFWFKDVDKRHKVELFNYTFLSVNYKDQGLNAHEIFQTVTYKITDNWGVAAVGRFAFNEFIPQLALAYQVYRETIFFAIYPYMQYSFLQDQFTYGAFGFVVWRPKLSEQWRMFHLLMFEPNFSMTGNEYGDAGHEYSFQQFRVGLEYKTGIQFGLGGTLEQLGRRFDFGTNLGIFIRKDL